MLAPARLTAAEARLNDFSASWQFGKSLEKWEAGM